MINILKMDLQRFKSNKIMLLLLAIFSTFQILAIYLMRQYSQSYEQGGLSIGSMSESEFFQYTMSQPPSWMLVYIAVFTIYFYMSEWSSGFSKNYISLQHARIYSVISKMIVLALFVLIMIIVAVCTNWIGRALLFDSAKLGDLAYFAKLLTSQFLLQWAFSIFILYITMLTKNTIVSLLIGMLAAFNVVGIALAVLDSLLKPIQLAPYWIVHAIANTKDYHNMLHVIGVAVVYIVIFCFASIRFKMKEDL